MKVAIGGVAQDIPPLTFVKLKRVWPLIQQSESVTDGMERMDLGVRMFAIMLMPADADMSEEAIATATVAFEAKLLAREVTSFPAALQTVLTENGFLPKAGEVAAAAENAAAPANPSTETLTV